MSQARLRAGAARGDITPDPAIISWIDQRPYDGVLDRLSARVVSLDDGATRAALVVLDLIDVSEQATARIRAAVAERTGIPAEHVLVHATHTHSAPRAPFTLDDPTFPGHERLRPVLADPVWQAWAEALPAVVAEVAERACAAPRPAYFGVGRAAVPEWLFNRRPLKPDGTVETVFVPTDATVLPRGLRFGPVEPTLTALTLRSTTGPMIALLAHLACHAVCIYGEHRGLSADWPGPAAQWLAASAQAEAVVLQGCAGDIVPARRGLVAREEFGERVISQALAAAGQAVPLDPAPLWTARRELDLPLRESVRRASGVATKRVEVQALGCGPLAIVGLPGEPLTAVGRAIREASPVPHTVVLGYSNGWGLGYVGLPGELARGGYEAGAGSGEDDCGTRLVEAALELLHEAARVGAG